MNTKIIPISYPSVGKEELDEVKKVFKSGWLGMGNKVKNFETEIGKYLGAKNVVAVNTGTSALHIALVSAGIKNGDEVIVPSLTYVASIQAIINAGAKPIFCDVEIETLNISIDDIKKKITKKTKAIMPVHYCGQACNMDELLAICKKYNIRLIEDAAHAFGSTYKNKKIGSFGDITCFSFDPVKIVTCGEGGAVVTNDDNVTKKIITKRLLGINRDTLSRYKKQKAWDYKVTTEGFRYHMSDINAAIGLVQLKKIDYFIKKRRKVVKMYDDAFKNIKQIKLLSHDYKSTSFLYYIIMVPERDKLISYLSTRGITAGVHYIPNHTQPFFKKYYTHLPITEKIFKQIITLPLYSSITDNQAKYIIKQVLNFFDKV